MQTVQPRSLARSSAVQALYQWQVGGHAAQEVLRQFREEHGLGKADAEYFRALLFGVTDHVDELDAHIGGFTDRKIAELDPVECAVLRLGAYELAYKPEVPYRVVINEGINLAKRFGATDGHKYVNGILDKLARKLRATELSGARRKSKP